MENEDVDPKQLQVLNVLRFQQQGQSLTEALAEAGISAYLFKKYLSEHPETLKEIANLSTNVSALEYVLLKSNELPLITHLLQQAFRADDPNKIINVIRFIDERAKDLLGSEGVKSGDKASAYLQHILPYIRTLEQVPPGESGNEDKNLLESGELIQGMDFPEEPHTDSLR
jgi:hypothetical protein